ncbi:hypothetical protein [Salinibacterium sp. ZJ454]|uniref:hypothetical protein n=1 Tax=Salinibacterium sp. ZJ454 TaxID=2708339 RepID=UPI001421A0F0|nr:hypothetical protein [Salinibacterium sp. ZJ454]
MDPIDVKLAEAGRLHATTAEQQQAVQTLLASRAAEVRRPRRRRVLLPALGIGGALSLLGAGVAVATQWGPWTLVPHGDIVIAREWTDVNGASLGACETHIAVDGLAPDVADAARHYLAGIDVDALQPDAEAVAAALVAVDLPERMPQLIAGADVNDYDVQLTGTGPIWDRAWHSDARIMQEGLVRTVLYGMADKVFEVSDVPSIGSLGETQCTTDPTPAGQ